MIALLRGLVQKGSPGNAIVDVQGVGYKISLPLDAWEKIEEGEEREFLIVSYIREDRFDLFGFLDSSSKRLFEACIALTGIGPKIALEICSVPKNLLGNALEQNNPGLLSSIKGIGKKTAEKLLVDFKTLSEKHPDLFVDKSESGSSKSSYDQDVIDALNSLGYDMPTIMNTLKKLPPDLASTEERVTAALRSL